VYSGRKSEKEKFAGARATYSVEAMMQDGKALQAGTSHNFGTNFSEPFEIQFLDKDGTLKFAHETSWGTSTRLIGAVIMTHGDERGLKLPPKIAPIQVVVLPIAAHKGGVSEACAEIAGRLRAAGLRVELDDRDTYSAGWKFNEWEMKGVPLRLEVGPRDLAAGQVTAVRRDTLEKTALPLEGLAEAIPALLQEIHSGMYRQALAFQREHTRTVHSLEELGEQVNAGYALAMWCGDRACEETIKERFSATSRNMPFDQTPVGETCVCCGKQAGTVMYFAKAY
jgi:prolyl-tRNA synthetase